jgi:quercetin dioxygenase-like cupin family protein
VRLTFDEPDERRLLAGGRVTVDVVHLAGMPVLRVAHEPGWRWSTHSAPEVGASRCPSLHVGVMLGGRMAVELLDGSTFEAAPGDVLAIPPGHDAWTVGSEPAVLVQFDEAESARRRFGL